MSMQVMTIVGARPQFIKAATVSRAFMKTPGVQEKIVHTGQHFDHEMSAVFFAELAIPAPAYNLDIHGGGHGEMTGRMLQEIESTILQENPNAVLIYGDTNSTLAGALAAAKLHIPVIHVEAGLRSFNRRMPEEINRVVADDLSSLLFCPTREAVKNLAEEGITDGVHHVGDVMFDATLFARQAMRERPSVLNTLGLKSGNYALCTIHRAENTDDERCFNRIMDYLESEATKQSIVFPLHPRTRKLLVGSRQSYEGILLTDPVGYFDMHCLLSGATQVFTDSGGLQKEAYFHRVPCVTLRQETEWIETVEAGWNRLWTTPDYKQRRTIEDYGDGRAAERIVETLTQFL